MMVDTHAHLSLDDKKIEEIIDRMGDNIIIASGCNHNENIMVLKLIEKYNNVYGTIGIHPTELKDNREECLKFIEDNINNSKIVGIGEIGLDYHYGKETEIEQKELFVKQINLAKKYKKAIVIHSRDSVEDTYNILSENARTLKKVLHCYSGSLEMAKKFIKIGTFLGVGGVLTYKNANKLREVVKGIDTKYLLLETDSPYLSPEPFRGEINEPYNIKYVAEKMAEIKKINVWEMLNITTKNASFVFDLKIDI